MKVSIFGGQRLFGNMKDQWLELIKKIDDLERTDRLDWTKLPTKELKIIQANLHRRDRKHWSEPALFELNSISNAFLIWILSETIQPWCAISNRAFSNLAMLKI